MRTESGGRHAAPDFEHQWLDDYLAGDDSGFISFYHRYRGQVYRYLLAHVPAEAANRLFVQSWLDFIRNARHIPADVTPGSAVFAEAHRLVLEAYRSLNKSLLLSFADGVVETAGEVPAEGFSNHEELHKTKLATLPPAWREALQIYLETGFDGDSLAHALHVSRETARSRLKRAFGMWRKLWPDGDTGVEDTLLRSTQHWIFRYRSLVASEPPDYLDARILRQADWHNHWFPRMVERFDRYWHIGLTALFTGLGVFGYLWTSSADPDFTLELSQPAVTPTLEIAAPALPAPPPLQLAPAAVASAPLASAVVASASVFTASGTETTASQSLATTAPAVAPAAAPAAAPPRTPSTPKPIPKAVQQPANPVASAPLPQVPSSATAASPASPPAATAAEPTSPSAPAGSPPPAATEPAAASSAPAAEPALP